MPSIIVGQHGVEIKNKAFAERLQEQMMSDLTKVIIVSILAAVFLVAYFVVQLTLFSNNEIEIKNNSSYI
jgi:hypothetical protein